MVKIFGNISIKEYKPSIFDMFNFMKTSFFHKPRTWVFVVLLTMPIIAVLLFVFYASFWSQIVSRGAPVNEQVQTYNETDFLLVLTMPNMDIPVHNVLVSKNAWLLIDI